MNIFLNKKHCCKCKKILVDGMLHCCKCNFNANYDIFEYTHCCDCRLLYKHDENHCCKCKKYYKQNIQHTCEK
jgi:hypothetical protein